MMGVRSRFIVGRGVLMLDGAALAAIGSRRARRRLVTSALGPALPHSLLGNSFIHALGSSRYR